MSRKLKELQGCGFEVSEPVPKGLWPYRFEHIIRSGNYTLGLDRPVEPLGAGIKLS